MKLDHFVIADKGKPMRVEDVITAVRKAREEGKPAMNFLRNMPDVQVRTLAHLIQPVWNLS